MTADPFAFLKKSMEKVEGDPRLIPNLVDEMRFFFRMLRVQLENGSPLMRESAAAEIKELKGLLERHPLVKKAL